MRSRGMFKALFATAAIVACTTTGATSASAAPLAPTCTSNRLCVWTGSIFSGTRSEFYLPDNSCVNFGGPRYSAYNRQSVTLVLSEGTCANPGPAWYIGSGAQQEYILPNGARSAWRCSVVCRPAANE
jgi:hypothetical protein